MIKTHHDTARPYPSTACIHQLFEEQAEKTPDAIAITGGEATMTYAALNRAANQLAWFLIRKGVGADVPVGLCLEGSLELPIALLAILKAGGCYVPLDPDYPAERLAVMTEDAGFSILLTVAKWDALCEDPHISHILLDRDRDQLFCGDDHNPISSTRAQHLAYINYTSGSTGPAQRGHGHPSGGDPSCPQQSIYHD